MLASGFSSPAAHEAAATNVAGNGMGDSERKSHRHCRVYRVPTSLEDLKPRLRSQRLRRNHHPVLGRYRFERSRRQGEKAEEDNQQFS